MKSSEIVKKRHCIKRAMFCTLLQAEKISSYHNVNLQRHAMKVFYFYQAFFVHLIFLNNHAFSDIL